MNPREFLTQTKFSGDRRLLPHQIEQAIFAVERKRSLNASETGTGKFLVALAMRLLVEHEAGHIVRCLYTCPKSALGQFEQEYTDHGYKTLVLRRGSDAIPNDIDTVLTANSTMLVTHREQLRGWCPILVVLDEAAAFKTATAARTKAVYGAGLDGIGGIIEEVPFVLAASGTLAPSHNGELYPHLRALAPAALLDERGRIMRRHTFEKTFCVFGSRRVAGGREVSVIVGSRNSAMLRQRIDPYVARVTLRAIAPTLPPERHELVPIAREDMKLDELAAIAGIEDPEIRNAVEMLAAAIRGDIVPTPDVDRETARIMEMIGGGTALAHLRRAYGLVKLPYVEDVVMSRRGGNSEERTPTLVFNTYRMTGDHLETLLRDQGVVVGRIHGGTSAAGRHAVISGIADGSIEAAILQIDAAGSALNLQAANRIIMLEPSWTPGANHQAVARAVRIGQLNPVLISWPTVRHSIDEAVMRVLRRKQSGLTELVAGCVMIQLDAIREMIVEARRSEAVTPPFPSGVAAGENRTGFLNASEAGRCTRWLWYGKHNVAGETHHPHGIFDRGHAFELWCTTYLAAGLARAKGRLLYAGTKQRRLTLPGFRLAGTPDGLIEWEDRSETVLEVKSHGTAQNYDNGPPEMHVRQTELNIELFHETTAHRPEDAIIIYGLAEDYFRLTLHRIERRPAVFVEMLGKAMAAFDADSATAVTAEGAVTKQCVICPYRIRCAAAQTHAIPAAGTGGLDQETLRSIDRLVAARRRAIESEDEAARARAEVEAEIIATLTDAGANKIKRSGYAVQLKTPKDGLAVLDIRSA